MSTKQPEALRLADHITASGQFTNLETLDQAAAELRRLHQHELANREWLEKTDWVQKTSQVRETWKHRADVLRERIEALTDQRDELSEALKRLDRAYVRLLEFGRDRIISSGGECDSVEVMERSDSNLRDARATLAKHQHQHQAGTGPADQS